MGSTDLTPDEKAEARQIHDALRVLFPGRGKFRALLSYFCPLAAVALCTWIAFRLDFNASSVGFLLLMVIALSAVYGGFIQATLTSLAAAACLDYFFFPPIFHFNIADPRDWLALGTFEFTALMLSDLSRRAQVRAAQAIRERQNSDHLYQAARRILLLDRSRDPGTFVASLIREEFGLSAVVLFDARTASTYASGDISQDVEQLARNAYIRDKEEIDSDARTSSWPVRLGARTVGGLALIDGNLTPLIATAVASLCAIAMERARSFENENRADAARQIEQLRAAVLDALAHQIKTPLTVIRTASSGLLAAGSLSDPQTELITLIDDQAKDLTDLTSRLLGAAQLDGADLEPQREPLLLSSLIKETLKPFDGQECRSRFQVSVADREPQVLADGKLIETALAQLIDNAIKYSDPGSPISIEVAAAIGEVIVTVRNQGLIISPADRDHIFERFYRGAETERYTAGTGLGLSIVRKIVDAHRGRVWAESEPEHGTAFSLALPAVGD